MNHLLKKSIKSLLNSSSSNEKSLLYINLNYYISPKIKDTSIKHFKNMNPSEEFKYPEFAVVEHEIRKDGSLSIELNKGRKFEMFIIRGKLYGFVSGSLISLSELYGLTIYSRNVYSLWYNKLKNSDIINKLSFGSIYINAKVLYVDDPEEIKFLRENGDDIINAKYEPIIDEDFNE